MYKSYHKNGYLYCICSYTNDKKNGMYKSYHINGQLNEICMYDNNKINGMYKSYNELGELKEECLYENGVINNHILSRPSSNLRKFCDIIKDIKSLIYRKVSNLRHT